VEPALARSRLTPAVTFFCRGYTPRKPAMPEFKITRVYETTFPVAHMPRPDLGQIDFSVEGETISVLMPRGDFERLGRKIARLIAETPPRQTTDQ
jgi:hypothetical protein